MAQAGIVRRLEAPVWLARRSSKLVVLSSGALYDAFDTLLAAFAMAAIQNTVSLFYLPRSRSQVTSQCVC